MGVDDTAREGLTRDDLKLFKQDQDGQSLE
jgi:hypothetical protein